MQANILAQITIVSTIALCCLTTEAYPVRSSFARTVVRTSQLTDSTQTKGVTVKGLRDMVFNPKGFVHVADDGVARSYARKSPLLDIVHLHHNFS
jgi:hypothetical protein